MRTLCGIIFAAVLGGAQTSAAAAHEGVCAGTRFVVSSGELWRDNESVGRSGHMGHALVYCGNGRVLDFASNCAGMERVAGHSGYGWMEYRISDDGVKLDVRPDGTGTGYYGCMLPIFEPGRPPRMLMQYSRPYRRSCVNVIHRTITLPDASPCPQRSEDRPHRHSTVSRVTPPPPI